MTAYACREHPDEPVTRRGTGCRTCAPEQRDRERVDQVVGVDGVGRLVDTPDDLDQDGAR